MATFSTSRPAASPTPKSPATRAPRPSTTPAPGTSPRSAAAPPPSLPPLTLARIPQRRRARPLQPRLPLPGTAALPVPHDGHRRPRRLRARDRLRVGREKSQARRLCRLQRQPDLRLVPPHRLCRPRRDARVPRGRVHLRLVLDPHGEQTRARRIECAGVDVLLGVGVCALPLARLGCRTK